MTMAILIGDALLLSAAYPSFVQGQAFAAEEAISNRRKDEGPTHRKNTK